MRFNKSVFLILYIITAVILMVGLIEIKNATGSPIEFGQEFIKDKAIVTIDFIPIDSPCYETGIEMGDTVIAADNIPVKNIYQMKTDVFYKRHANDVVILKIRNNGESRHVPIVLTSRKTNWEMFLMIITAFVSMIILLFFFVTFRENQKYALDISICYFLLIIAYIFSFVSFEKPQVYIFLIICASFSPSIPIYIGIKLLTETKHILLRFIPFVISLFICLFWLFAYIRWAMTFDYLYLTQLTSSVKLTQLGIGMMTTIAIVFLVSVVIKKIKGKHESYVPLALLAIIAGYIPYMMLYALPVALGKHEIMSVDLTLLFTLIPLVGILIYNNFIYENSN